MCVRLLVFFFFQAEDGIRDLVRSRGLGDVYKRQILVRMLGRDRFIDRQVRQHLCDVRELQADLLVHLSLIHI